DGQATTRASPRRSTGRSGWDRSEPEADAGDEPRVVRIPARCAPQIRRVAERFLANDADVRGDLAPYLVAEPERELDSRKPPSEAPLAVCAAVPVELDLGLEDQPRRDRELVAGIDACSRAAAVAEIRRRLELEAVRRDALSAECGPRPARPGLEVMPCAGDQLPPARDRDAREKLDVGVRRVAAHALAFAAEPYAAKASSRPRSDLPVEPFRCVELRGLETVDQHERVERILEPVTV